MSLDAPLSAKEIRRLARARGVGVRQIGVQQGKCVRRIVPNGGILQHIQTDGEMDDLRQCVACGGEIDAMRVKRRAKFCSDRCNTSHYKARYFASRGPRIVDLPSSTVGAMHELLICADLMRRGYHVFRAMSPACACDVIALRDGKMIRVEVKTGNRSPMTGKLSTSLASTRVDMSKFDVLAIVVYGGEIIYEPPLEHAPVG